MPGPLADVDTIVAGINMDVNRLLYMGDGRTLIFKVPDATQISNWRVVLTWTKSFDRVAPEERTVRDGSEVIIKIADEFDELPTILGLTELHVELEGVIYSVSKTPPVAPNEARVYRLLCKTRTVRTKYFDNKR